MPVYEYKCKSPTCEHITEVIRPSSAKDFAIVCEKCGYEAERVISSCNHYFKEPGGVFKHAYNHAKKKNYIK